VYLLDSTLQTSRKLLTGHTTLVAHLQTEVSLKDYRYKQFVAEPAELFYQLRTNFSASVSNGDFSAELHKSLQLNFSDVKNNATLFNLQVFVVPSNSPSPSPTVYTKILSTTLNRNSSKNNAVIISVSIVTFVGLLIVIASFCLLRRYNLLNGGNQKNIPHGQAVKHAQKKMNLDGIASELDLTEIVLDNLRTRQSQSADGIEHELNRTRIVVKDSRSQIFQSKGKKANKEIVCLPTITPIDVASMDGSEDFDQSIYARELELLRKSSSNSNFAGSASDEIKPSSR
jgi:hypothetical protein